MIIKWILSLLAFLHPHGRREPALGPQSDAEIDAARSALHGEHYGGDMLGEISDAGKKDTYFRWPGYPGRGIVPFVIDPSLAQHTLLIATAIEQYYNLTCIMFVPRTTQKDYINIFKGKGCYSFVGNQGKGRQDVSLGDGCYFIGTVVHELGHAIGLFHEHQRSDRDKYVTIYKNNVTAGQEHNFNRTNPAKELILTPYDYSSIMHYGNYAFSKQPGRLMTMEAKNGQKLLEPYEKPGFTNRDIEMIKKLYKC